MQSIILKTLNSLHCVQYVSDDFLSIKTTQFVLTHLLKYSSHTMRLTNYIHYDNDRVLNKFWCYNVNMINQEDEKITVMARTPDLQRFLDIIISVGDAKQRCAYGEGEKGKRTCTSERVFRGAACNLTAENGCWMGHPVILDLLPEGTHPIINRPNLLQKTKSSGSDSGF